MSLCVLHFGLSQRPKGLAHHSILFGPHYRELVNEIFNGPDLAPVPHLGRADID